MELKPPHALGPLSDWTVPQKWFAHFYGIGAIWNAVITFFFLSSTFYYSLDPTHEAVYLTALVLLEFHLVRRFLETVGLMRYPEQARMHGIAYLFGVVYYLVLPLTVLPDDAFESIATSIRKMEGVHRAALGIAGKVGQDILDLLSFRNMLVS
jgi:3-oxo-5-alpha-steroid 4-dehydrogenase 3